MGIQVETYFLRHEGGTKFYETVLLKKIEINFRGESECTGAMLIKRWGPWAHANTGGKDCQVHSGTLMLCEGERKKILKQKMSSTKGYKVVPTTHSLHQMSGDNVHKPSEVLEKVQHHYASSDLVNQITKWIGGITMAATDTSPVTKAEPVFDETVDRGDAWGTF
jgi:hypothetical protein